MTLLHFLRSLLRRIAAVLLFRGSLKAHSVSPKVSEDDIVVSVERATIHTLKSLREEITSIFRSPCTLQRMLSMSAALRVQYKAKLNDSESCMLPSFCHALPTGHETGTVVALDVGGSTFRVALVELRGRDGAQEPMVIKRMASNKIDESIRRLPSKLFFDWIAGRILAMLEEDKDSGILDTVVPLGLAWSFPIEQTSHRSGKMQGMGKGFQCHEDTIGQDLGQIIEVACARKGFKVRVDAIINDSSATLLSQAYLDPSTSMGLILGTGTNAAAFLPTSSMGTAKFGVRDPSWFTKAEQVITNTEISMFGKGILPETRFDETLNRQHQISDFQPLEYMTTGRYLGELLRLIIVEAVGTGELFQGALPERLREKYSLDTEILARLESDTSAGSQESIAMVRSAFALKVDPTLPEVSFLQAAAEAISYRASAYISVAVHALWALQRDTDVELSSLAPAGKTSIACNGSVILKYPCFKSRCETFTRDMLSAGVGSSAAEIVFQPTHEAAIFGAAVAVALGEGS